MPTGSMTVTRYFHTATLLRNGQVLIAGGAVVGPDGSAELYDPAAGTFTPPAAWPWQGVATRRRCCATGRCSSRGGLRRQRQLSRERGVIRPSCRDIHRHWQHGHGKVFPHGDVVAERDGTHCRRNGDDGDFASAELYDPAPGHSRPLAAWARRGGATPRRCCPTGRCSSPAEHMAALSRARSYTTQQPGCSPPPAAWAWPGRGLPRRCCPMGRCSSPADRIRLAAISRERGAIRPSGRDVHRHRQHGRGKGGPHGDVVARRGGAHSRRRRHDCGSLLLERANYTTQPPGPSPQPAARPRRGSTLPRRCCPTGTCSSPAESPARP